MSVKVESFLRKPYSFSEVFRIEKFEESKYADTKSIIFNNGTQDIGVSLSVFGKGWFENHYDDVMLYIKNFRTTDTKCILIFTCIMSIVDINGKKKHPRSFEFQFLLRNNEAYSEKCYERSLILSDPYEYLPDENLTVVVDGTVEEWYAPNRGVMQQWAPEYYAHRFQMEYKDDVLQVYLPKNSAHAMCLMENSSVFRKMWETPMKEGIDERVLLRSEELPAMLCMLLFIETGTLIFHEATVFDLYKIADKYQIETLLEECRKCIKKVPLKTVYEILHFAISVSDQELNTFVRETYSWKTGEAVSWKTGEAYAAEIEIGKELDTYFVCGNYNYPSKLIHTEEEFKEYLNHLLQKIDEINSLDDHCDETDDGIHTDFVFGHWTLENILNYIKIEDEEYAILREDYIHFESLRKLSKKYKRLKISGRIGCRILPEFLCMLYFIETKKLLLYKITIFRLYIMADECNVSTLRKICRDYIKQIPLKTVSDILDLSNDYDEKDLKQMAEFYLSRVREVKPNFELADNLDSFILYEKSLIPYTIIKTSIDFENCLRNLWKKFEDVGEITTEDFKRMQISEIETGLESFEFYR